MTIEILVHGNVTLANIPVLKPPAKKYKHTCNECKAVFLATKDERKKNLRSGDTFTYICCPECNNAIFLKWS